MAGGRRATWRAVPLLAALGLHAALFAVFLWRLGSEPRFAPAAVMNVELTTLGRRPPHRRTNRPTPLRPHTARSSLEISPPLPIAPIPAATPTAGGEDPGVRRALRGLIGCRNPTLASLTPEERQRCLNQLAKAPDGAGPHLNLDTRGAFAPDAEPYLARKPRNGCKVRAAGGADAMGRQGPVGGVACSWAF